MNPKMLRVAALGVVSVGLVILFLATHSLKREFVVKAYLGDGTALRQGAPVRLAGVDIGSVKGVRLRPEQKAPVEVIMALKTEYGPKIPKDSTVRLATAGVLGETYVQIDTASASGPPLQENDVLKSSGTPEMTSQEMIEKLTEALSKRCPCANGSETPGSLAPSSKSTAAKH